jgi:nucleotide-binding universal stress UspA family protein
MLPQPPKPIKAILCPTDFSLFSSRALRHATVLAQQHAAKLKVLHVVPGVTSYAGGSPYFPAPLAAIHALRDHAEAEMRSFVAPAVEARVPVQTEVREGEAWREIVAAAEELPADLVVMGTHGRGGFERLFLGSVAEKLLRRLPCPVLTVCHEEGRTWEAPGLVRRILCATDLSATSPDTIAFALSLAAKNQAQVTLLHVVEAVPATAEPLYLPASLREELERKARQELHEAAQEAAARFGVEIDERLGGGRPYAEILRVAAEERADLLVMGPGRGVLDRLLLGSNAHHVVREATCPVLTVRPLGTARPAPRESVKTGALTAKL